MLRPSRAINWKSQTFARAITVRLFIVQGKFKQSYVINQMSWHSTQECLLGKDSWRRSAKTRVGSLPLMHLRQNFFNCMWNCGLILFFFSAFAFIFMCNDSDYKDCLNYSADYVQFNASSKCQGRFDWWLRREQDTNCEQK